MNKYFNECSLRKESTNNNAEPQIYTYVNSIFKSTTKTQS